MAGPGEGTFPSAPAFSWVPCSHTACPSCSRPHPALPGSGLVTPALSIWNKTYCRSIQRALACFPSPLRKPHVSLPGEPAAPAPARLRVLLFPPCASHLISFDTTPPHSGISPSVSFPVICHCSCKMETCPLDTGYPSFASAVRLPLLQCLHP